MMPYKRELLYLESYGEQFVDTGVTLSKDFQSLDAEIQIVGENKNPFLIGTRWNVAYLCVAYDSGNFFLSCFSDHYVEYKEARLIRSNVHIDKEEFRVTNLDEGVTASFPSNTSYETETTNSFKIFATGGFLFPASMRFFSAKVIDGGRLTLDLIPVIDNEDVPCIYNRANGEFYYNQSEKPFIVCEKSYPHKIVNVGRKVSTRFVPLGLNSVEKSSTAYIQDGLVAHFDGIENAGRLLHSDEARTWINLVDPSNSASLFRSASFGENCVFADGTDCVAMLNNIDATTLEAAFKLGTQPTYSHGIRQMLLLHYGRLDTNEGAVLLCYPPSNTKTFSINASIDWGANYTSEYSIEGDSFVIQFTSSLEKLKRMEACYINGESVPVGAPTYADGVGRFNRMRIGGQYYGLRCLRGQLYALRLYNRKLTAEEFAYNYAIDKERFGL